MSLIPQKRITKKIDNSHILWFEESNSWTQFEEPVWYIYKQLISDSDRENISLKFSKRYGLDIDESIHFVNDVIKEIHKLSSATFLRPKTFSALHFNSREDFFSTRTYCINQNVFEISFMTRSLEYSIHPSFAHLELKNTTVPYFKLKTFTSGSSSVLKIEDKAWAEDDVSQLKRRLFIELTSLIYGKTDKDWLSYIHGSAVSNGKEIIVLSTACGSGKSTLAAILCKQGLHFVTDDYVPIDARFCKAYPFPAALSVKDGSYPVLSPLFKQLETAEVFRFKGTNKTVRYLTFPTDKDFYKPLPVKNLVFIEYKPSATFSFRKVPTLEAIRRFNEEAWVSFTPLHARKFINWFPELNCYELKYSDNEKAIHAIKELFKTPLKRKHSDDS